MLLLAVWFNRFCTEVLGLAKGHCTYTSATGVAEHANVSRKTFSDSFLPDFVDELLEGKLMLTHADIRGFVFVFPSRTQIANIVVRLKSSLAGAVQM
jgi:hypothetical protein